MQAPSRWTGPLQARWIVGNDGQVAGALRLDGHVISNPALQQTVRIGPSTLSPIAVRVLPVSPAQPRPPLLAPVNAILDRHAVIDSAYSLPCGAFHVRGSGFDPGAPVDVSLVEQYPANPHDYGALAEQRSTNKRTGSPGGIRADVQSDPPLVPILRSA